MKTLDEEILGILTKEPVSARDLAKRLAADVGFVRYAIRRLNVEGVARMITRGRTMFAASLDYAGRICVICGKEFQPHDRSRGERSMSRTCSTKCKADLWRQHRDREAFVARVRETSSRPEQKARIRELAEKIAVRKRSAEGRAAQAEANRKMWADPYRKAAISVAIKKRHSQPESKKKFADRMNARWADPEQRKKLIEGMKGRSRSASYCAEQKNRAKNQQRKRRADYLKTDEAHSLQALRASGKNITQCAEAFGMPRHWAASRLRSIAMALNEEGSVFSRRETAALESNGDGGARSEPGRSNARRLSEEA